MSIASQERRAIAGQLTGQWRREQALLLVELQRQAIRIVEERKALDGERIVATSGISIVEKPPYFGCPTGRLGLISGMYTDPAYRRKGIAKHLLSRIVEEARIRKCGAVHITASDAGVPLYRSLGFSHNGNFLQLVL